MSEHISAAQIEKFCAKILDVPEMVVVGEHLATCAACQQVFQTTVQQRRNYAPIVINLSPEWWLKDAHLEYEHLVGYADNTLDETESEMVDIHLKLCSRCRADVHSFIEFRQKTEHELSVRYGPDDPIVRDKASAHYFPWAEHFRKPAYVAALATTVVGVVILAGVLLNQARTDRRDHQQTIEVSGIRQPLVQNEAPPSPAVNKPTEQAQINTVAARPANRQIRGIKRNLSAAGLPSMELLALNDGGNKIAVDQAGHLIGLEALPSQFQQVIKEVLLAQNLAKPEALADLSGEQRRLRSGDQRKPSFKLLTPKRTVIVEDQPTFEWEPLNGATSYQVYVVGPNNREVANSGLLPPTATQWKPSTPLKRGVIYKWAVGAIINGEEIISPAAPAPEMKFKVLEEEKAAELSALKKQSRSHLALGVFYAQAGMLEEAEREFQILTSDNPNSPIAANLLSILEAWR